MTNKKQFKPNLESLVKLFESNENYYKSKDYKEDHLRQEFLNPFFKALGWDMDNEQHFAPQYREVIHEDRIEIEGKPKAPDYSFRIGTERKFFVEAKAAFVNVEKEMAPSFQLRRYSWSGKLPVSILTDFEEFSIYDTTIEPKVSDRADIARIKYLQFQNYPDEIDYLWDTFSKEAVWSGSFDKFAKKERRGNELVDKAFLKEIEQWRNLLAKDIAVNNPRIDIFQLNEAVQKIIDRIIFLRIAEDRGIERYETLKEIIKYQNSYPYLVKLFYKAREKYNSNLFDFNADIITPKLKISDKILDRIINTLYFPKSPYEFSVIGVEILGSVYEQFLGKVIRLTKGHNAIIEEKPEVKKAGGVYYTPKYIVDYIVKNTVGELVKRKTPKEVSKLRIVDPACGSGSFLLGAYTFLLDWHLKYYTNNDPAKYVKSKALFKDNEGNYLLSTAEKKRILVNNIYGVDIDAQAVEVSKLSLALKMLENENSETINTQLRLFAERILPDLSTNIKCGNSLISSDYYDGKDISTISDEEIRKINAFDWEKEFSEVFKGGTSTEASAKAGFDAVIGNPPYVNVENILQTERVYLLNKYKYLHGRFDLFVAFIEKALTITKEREYLSFIVPYPFLYEKYGNSIRKYIVENFTILQIIDLSNVKIFLNANVKNTIFVIRKQKNISDTIKILVGEKEKIKPLTYSISQKTISEHSNFAYRLELNSTTYPIIAKMEKQQYRIGDFYYVNWGCRTGNIKKYVHKEKMNNKYEKPMVNGKNVQRYQITFTNDYLDYIVEELYNPMFPELFEHSKIFVPDISGKNGIRAMWDNSGLYAEHTLSILIHKNHLNGVKRNGKYVLDIGDSTKPLDISDIYTTAILNSKLMNFYFYVKIGGNLHVYPNDLKRLPIPLASKEESDQVCEYVKNVVNIKKSEFASNDSQNIKLSEQKINLLENKIDQLVYQLYGLTKEEIELVEHSEL